MFECGDIIKLTNTPHDWQNRGEILYGMYINSDTHQNFNVIIVYIDNVTKKHSRLTWWINLKTKPYLVSLGENKTNFKWTNNGTKR